MRKRFAGALHTLFNSSLQKSAFPQGRAGAWRGVALPLCCVLAACLALLPAGTRGTSHLDHVQPAEDIEAVVEDPQIRDLRSEVERLERRLNALKRSTEAEADRLNDRINDLWSGVEKSVKGEVSSAKVDLFSDLMDKFISIISLLGSR